MAHTLIIGMSESGKTTIARQLCWYYRAQGRGTIVLDPLNDPRWKADFQTADAAEFLDVLWRSKSCYGFIDEGGSSVGRYKEEMQLTATQSRHWGHSMTFIAQGATQLAPIVRDQCRHLFLFCAAKRNGILLAEDWNQPELENCGSLLQGEHMHAVKFGGLIKHSRRQNDEPSDSDKRNSSGNSRPGNAGQKESGTSGGGSGDGSDQTGGDSGDSASLK